MKKGFTLLEILVVIGIIAILVALGATSYSTAQKKARDARRKSDLKSIQNALEQYYSICNFQYPFSGTGNLSGSLTCGSTTLITYPTDPLNTSYRYACVGTCNANAYTICPSSSVSSGQKLETEDCSTNNCCLTNRQ